MPYEIRGGDYRTEKRRFLAIFVQPWADLFKKTLLPSLNREETTWHPLECLELARKGFDLRVELNSKNILFGRTEFC